LIQRKTNRNEKRISGRNEKEETLEEEALGDPERRKVWRLLMADDGCSQQASEAWPGQPFGGSGSGVLGRIIL
jgi:hypothetical protein